VFSIYVLLQKEKLISQVKRISIALFPRSIHGKLVYLANLTNKSFSNFLSGQLLEAIIIGSMFFISMKIFNFPFVLVISILIGITSFIPIVGAFIGAIVGTLLIMVEDVRMGFWFLVMFLIIQQIEGNLIYPNVAGKTVGLPSIWVLVAVTLGGSLFGILGIILFVPLGNIIYTLIKEFVENRLKVKNVTKADYDKY
jgi:predicted PurR-regulated permease PerM